MNLSPSQLHGFLYGFDDFLGVRPLIEPNDIPLFKVRVIPLELGFELRAADPTEQYFHVEIYACTSPPHAEVWEIKAWNESLTKRYRHKPPVDEKVNSLTQKISQYMAELTRLLVSRGMTIPHARSCAEILVKGEDFQKEEVIHFMILPQTYVMRLDDLREELIKASEGNNTTETEHDTIL